LKIVGAEIQELRLDVIGVDATLRGASVGDDPDPRDVRARIVGRTKTLRDAQRIGREIESVWINGPAGGGGATWSAREVIAAASTLLPRELVRTSVHFEVA
jgi:hypothetical protein